MKKTVIILFSFTVSTLAYANTSYIADNISLPVRSGPGLDQKISNRLLPGTKITILQKDDKTKYTQVEWAKGKSGWVSTHILTSQKPAIARLKIATLQIQQLKKQIAQLNSKTANTLSAATNINPDITQASSIKKLQLAMENLTAENRKLTRQIQQTAGGSSNTESPPMVGSEIDWFLWGGFVVGLSFGAGILITKIRWRKDRLFT